MSTLPFRDRCYQMIVDSMNGVRKNEYQRNYDLTANDRVAGFRHSAGVSSPSEAEKKGTEDDIDIADFLQEELDQFLQQ